MANQFDGHRKDLKKKKRNEKQVDQFAHKIGYNIGETVRFCILHTCPIQLLDFSFI